MHIPYVTMTVIPLIVNSVFKDQARGVARPKARYLYFGAYHISLSLSLSLSSCFSFS